MKILLCSAFGEGFWFALRLQAEGHTVDVWLDDKHYQNCLHGLIPKLLKERPDEKQLKKYDLILFDLTHEKLVKYAEQCKQLHLPVIGHSELAHQLEHNREFGIEVMEEVGIDVPHFEVFNNIDDGIKYIKQQQKRFVFKPSGSQKTDTTYVAKLHNSQDLLRFMDIITDEVGHNVEFMLQDFEPGQEISCEAWFDGKEFYMLNFTLEEKKFMNDNIGPNTGCAGNLVGVFDTYENPQALPRVFYEGLYKMKDWLQQQNYKGMIDLNSIIDSHGVLCGLEWTPRFGYDASATFLNLIDGGHIGDFLQAIASGNGDEVIGLPLRGQYSASVRMTIPPYPSEELTKQGIPIIDIDDTGEFNALEDCYVHDFMVEDGEAVTAGAYGFVAAPLGVSDTPAGAFAKVEHKLEKIIVPNAQYRSDVGESTIKRFKKLKETNWI